MNRAEELLDKCQEHLRFGKNHDDLISEINNYLNRKDKLVVGSEWVCDVECYGMLYIDTLSFPIANKGDVVKIAEVNDTPYILVSDLTPFETIYPYDQFLACFSPKGESNG